MAAIIDTNLPSVSAAVVAEMLPFPLSRPAIGLSLQIGFSDFHSQLVASVIGSTFNREAESGTLAIRAAVGTDAIVDVNLAGSLVKDRTRFHPEQASLKIEPASARARAEFVATTFMAMLGLAEEVQLQIPEISLGLRLKFDMPLPEISRMLQRRQLAYRLMVIERATGIKFILPSRFSGDEVETIAFIYQAIVERSFAWPVETIQVSIPATQEWLARLAADDHPTDYGFGPEPATRTLLGQSIKLGHETVIIRDGIIEHAETVRRELACGDGHLVEVVIRSLSGQAIYQLPGAPRLPGAPWDSEIQSLIDLESQFDSRLAERYHALAAATLADLTEEERLEVTVRPELDEDVFSTIDLDKESD